MLRHPVDRVLSLYYYLKENNYPGYEWMKEMTQEEFIETSPEAHNNQTTLLCGYLTNPDVELAKERLESFDIVGITQLFNESLFLLKKKLKWQNIDYRRVNITKSRLTKEELPKELLLNKLDNLSVKEKWRLQQFVEKLKESE